LQLYLRPSVFSECQAQNLGTEKNPCPFVSCKWNLTLDVNEKGNVLDNQIDNMTNEQTANCQYTCVLQAIANYSTPYNRLNDTLYFSEQEISDILSVSRQRVSQIVQQSIEKIKNAIRETHENTSKFEDFSH
jgi:DNA-directed RNA polymerase specialized sigma subunit